MTAQERTGWRDEEISARHRIWGVNCPAVDLDFLMGVGDDGSYGFVAANADPQDFEAVCAMYEVLKKVRRKPKPPVEAKAA